MQLEHLKGGRPIVLGDLLAIEWGDGYVYPAFFLEAKQGGVKFRMLEGDCPIVDVGDVACVVKAAGWNFVPDEAAFQAALLTLRQQWWDEGVTCEAFDNVEAAYEEWHILQLENDGYEV